MGTRAFFCTLLASALTLSFAGCAPGPASPTATKRPRPSTSVPTATLVPAATASPSPTSPSEPQVVGEIVLRSLPGVGHSPQAITVLDGRAYVVNRNTGNVSVIEGGEVVKVIAVGDAPVAAAADPATGLVYVANETDHSISIISGDQVVSTVPAPRHPACVASLDGRLYTGGRRDNLLMVLDGVTGEAINSVPLEGHIGIFALATNPATNLLYASVYDSVQIVDLDSLTVVAQLEHDVYTTLGADPIAGGFFVGEYDAKTNTHYLVKYAAFGQKELGRTPVGGAPRGMAVDTQRGRIYVANSGSNDVSVIDAYTMRLLATVPAGLRPVDVAVEGDHVFVVNADSDSVAAIDGESNRLSSVVPVSIMARGMAVHPDTGRLYVACASTNSVFVLEDEQVVDEIPVGLHPAEVAFSPDATELFVLNYVGGNVMVVSTSDNHILKTAQVGRLPQGLAIAPDTGQLYTSDALLDAEDQRLLRRAELATIYGSMVKPVDIQVDAQAGRAYMIASNGVPGSNSGLIVYIVDLKSGERVEASVGGLSMTGLALDPWSQCIFSTAARFGRYELIVNDPRTFERTASLGLPEYPAALAYNSETYHLFVCLVDTQNTPGGSAELWVIDSRGLGTVARLRLPDQADVSYQYELAVDAARGYVYVADTQRGTVHVVRDVSLEPPPSPTPAHTPTPWPTQTPHPQPSSTVASIIEASCKHAPGAPFEPYWASDIVLRTGLACPVGEMASGFVAEQAFERGHMLWREADHTVFVFYGDGLWNSFPDRWHEGMAEYGCEASAPANLLQPKRGFGLVWCEEQGVGEKLGWATNRERGHTGAWQVFEQGQMIAAGGRSAIYAMLQNGTLLEYSAP